jgi:ABC-type sugar transport system permease subunit
MSILSILKYFCGSLQIKGRNSMVKEGRLVREISYFLLLPAFLLYTGFVIVPAISSFYYSLTSWDGLSALMPFVGLRNFTDMFHDSRFYVALKNTLGIAITVTILENVIALMLALLVDKIRWFKSFFRSMIYLPVLLSGIITGFIWSVMMNYSFGVINQMFDLIHLGAFKVNWLGDPHIALVSIMITLLWKSAGYYMIIYLAGLQGIPQELLEASRIDGASGFQQFRHVTFPLLAGTLTVNFTLSLIGGLKVFDQIAVMTDGGPGFATETIAYQIYKVAFADARQGYGTALAMVLFGITLIFATIQVSLLRKREVEL